MSASGSPFGNAYTPADWPFPRAPDPPGFFDNLLNPAARDSFAYPLASPYDMSRPQPGRLSNGYVDLTSPHVDLTAPDTPPRRKRSTASPGPSAKRQKRPDAAPPAAIEQIDLSQDDDVLAVLQKQREHAVAAQAKPEETVAAFNTFNCVICMDRPTDISATACGHLFCHTCLMEALIAGENRAGPGEPRRSQCPVCRKTISRNKATDVIPLLLKKGLASQPRRKAAASAATTKVQ